MNKNKFIIALAITTLLILIGAITLLSGYDSDYEQSRKKFEELKDNPVSVRTIDDSLQDRLKLKDLGEGALGLDKENLTFEEVVYLLRKKFDGRIHKSSVQIELLDELVAYYKKHYPDRWVELLQETIMVAFPEHAKEIFNLAAGLNEYEHVIKERKEELVKMEPGEQRAEIMETQASLFGKEKADEIWAAQRRNWAVADSLDSLSKNQTATPDEKLEAFADTLKKQFGEDYQLTMNNKRFEFTDKFYDVIGNDLAKMPASDRKEFFKQTWKTMGFDDAAVERLDQLEAKRDQRWDNGQIYMAERKKLMANSTGDDREQKLNALRKKYFNQEWETIKNEEDAGFYRYQQSRQYGRN